MLKETLPMKQIFTVHEQLFVAFHSKILFLFRVGPYFVCMIFFTNLQEIISQPNVLNNLLRNKTVMHFLVHDLLFAKNVIKQIHNFHKNKFPDNFNCFYTENNIRVKNSISLGGLMHTLTNLN